jgi:glycosyltransferase involved in cell wall biosynthesis
MAAEAGGRAASVLALVAARNEEDRIADTVAALRAVPTVGSVVVVDDGSLDHTAERARSAGATVIRGGRAGKGDAIEAALSLTPAADAYVLADGDLGASAVGLAPLADAVLTRGTDLAVGVLPDAPTGGFGLVKRFATGAVGRIAGYRPRAPLSGQRVATRECLWACRPLARGFGLESAMTADAVRMGFRVEEILVRVEHRFTRRDPAGFLHRGRQGADIARALATRIAGLR